MFQADTILVPVDFSQHTRRALDYAALFASRLDVPIHVLHVWEPPAYLDPTLKIEGARKQTLEEYARSAAGKEMRGLLADFEGRHPGITVKARLESGDPTAVIVALTEEAAYGLLVMGTREPAGLQQMLLGSVAEKVVRRAACPVLTVHGP